MSAAIRATTPDLRSELIDWRERLEASANKSSDTFQLNGLLREVNAAIESLSREGYGVCQVCHEKMDSRVVYCGKCRTPHHEECWSYMGMCSTYGCREIRFERN